MRSVKVLSSIGLLGALLTAACGDTARSLNPTAPSSVAATGQSLEGGVSGPTGGKPGDKGKPEAPKVPVAPVPPTTGTPAPTNPATGNVQLEGLITAVAGRSITVNRQAVIVPTTAVIRHGSRAIAFGELKMGDRVHVKASMRGTTLEASEVKVQNPGDPVDDVVVVPPVVVPPVVAPPVVVEVPVPATVTVELVDATAAELGGDTGTFRLVRTGTNAFPLAEPLDVMFTITGTALNGVDYQTIRGSATFFAGESTVDVVVRPIFDGRVEAPETVILTLTAGANYVVGLTSTATITIIN